LCGGTECFINISHEIFTKILTQKIEYLKKVSSKFRQNFMNSKFHHNYYTLARSDQHPERAGLGAAPASSCTRQRPAGI